MVLVLKLKAKGQKIIALPSASTYSLWCLCENCKVFVTNILKNFQQFLTCFLWREKSKLEKGWLFLPASNEGQMLVVQIERQKFSVSTCHSVLSGCKTRHRNWQRVQKKQKLLELQKVCHIKKCFCLFNGVLNIHNLTWAATWGRIAQLRAIWDQFQLSKCPGFW